MLHILYYFPEHIKSHTGIHSMKYGLDIKNVDATLKVKIYDITFFILNMRIDIILLLT